MLSSGLQSDSFSENKQKWPCGARPVSLLPQVGRLKSREVKGLLRVTQLKNRLVAGHSGHLPGAARALRNTRDRGRAQLTQDPKRKGGRGALHCSPAPPPDSPGQQAEANSRGWSRCWWKAQGGDCPEVCGRDSALKEGHVSPITTDSPWLFGAGSVTL